MTNPFKIGDIVILKPNCEIDNPEVIKSCFIDSEIVCLRTSTIIKQVDNQLCILKNVLSPIHYNYLENVKDMEINTTGKRKIDFVL